MKNIVMIGPGKEGLGGISRVVRIWEENAFFEDYSFQYLASVTDNRANDLFIFFKNIFKFLLSLRRKGVIAYVHTSSKNSFYRKSVFILVAILFRRRIILHIHPSHFYDYFCKLDGLTRCYVSFLLRKIFCFVVLTDDMKIKMEGLFPGKIVYVLNNPVDIQKMTLSGSYIRKDNSLVYLGWFIKGKGVFDLVDAIEIIALTNKNIHLDFYGTKQIETLRTYIQKKNLTRHITVHGWINDTRKVKVLLECTCLVLPSYSEGIPNVILEAMATKTPIISTLVGGIKEVLSDRQNAIIVKAQDSQDLSNKIIQLLADPELRNTISQNAFYDVSSKYDVKIIKKKFLKILDSVIS